jgi:hypothetical protein
MCLFFAQACRLEKAAEAWKLITSVRSSFNANPVEHDIQQLMARPMKQKRNG